MVALQALPDLAPTPSPTHSPTPKVVAATGGSAVGAALSTVVSWAVVQYCPITLPDNVAQAVTFLIITGLTAAFTFASGYLTRPSRYHTIAVDPVSGRARICQAQRS